MRRVFKTRSSFLVKMKAPYFLILIVIQLSSKFLKFCFDFYTSNKCLFFLINYFLLKWIACFIATTHCCSSDINIAVDNAFVSCPINLSCNAECYRGYIFPSGSTEESYSCQKGVWTPMLFSCKRTLFFFLFSDWMYAHIWLRVPIDLIILFW